jgi:hypothetical protein
VSPLGLEMQLLEQRAQRLPGFTADRFKQAISAP